MPSLRLAKSMTEKLEVIDWIEENCPRSPTRAAAHFQNKGWKLSPAQGRYWWKKRDEMRAASLGLVRLNGAGAKPQLDAIVYILFDMVVQRRSQKLKLSREWIQDTARQLAHAEGHEAFAASDKWLSLFMGRYGLSLTCLRMSSKSSS